MDIKEKKEAYLIGVEDVGKLKMQKPRNVSFDKSKFYFEKKIESDQGEKLGDLVFLEKFSKTDQKMLKKL